MLSSDPVTIPISHVAHTLSPFLHQSTNVLEDALRKWDTDEDGALTLTQCESILRGGELFPFPLLFSLFPFWMTGYAGASTIVSPWGQSHASHKTLFPTSSVSESTSEKYSNQRDLHSIPFELSIVEGLLCGALAGVVGKTLVAPADRIKILFQVQPELKYSLRAAARVAMRVVSVEGWSALWKGNCATLALVAPKGAITYMTYDSYFQLFRTQSLGLGDNFARFLAGASAAVSCVLLAYPLDMMRARMAVYSQTLSNTGATSNSVDRLSIPKKVVTFLSKGAHSSEVCYDSYWTAFRSTAHTHGIKGLYCGLLPTLAGVVPYAGMSFLLYGSLKEQVSTRMSYPSEDLLSPWQLLLLGGFSSGVAQSVTYPLDVLRRRRQVSPLEPQYSTMAQAARHIYWREGVRGFFKGLSMNWIKGPISTGTGLVVNDLARRRIRDYHVHDMETSSSLYQEGSSVGLTVLESLLCGAFAGFFAKLALSPFERLKILHQIHSQHAPTATQLCSSARNITQNDGVLALWRGTAASLVRVIPYAALVYTFFDIYSQRLPRIMFCHPSHPETALVAGALAGVTATLITYPIDVIRSRTAAHIGHHPRYASLWSALRRTVREEGGRSLFVGLRPTLLGIAPYSGITFWLYRSGKKKFGISDETPTFNLRLFVGTCSAFLAQALTHPIHILSRRQQVSFYPAYLSSHVLSDMRHTIRYNYHIDGLWRGLYRGAPLLWAASSFSVGLSFSLNDFMRQRFSKYKHGVHVEYQTVMEKLRSGACHRDS